MNKSEKRGKPPRGWKQDPEAVRADILGAARTEFARHGLSGARVQNIVERTQTSKRMIFYYFGDKESLYRAVLEEAYREVRQGEAELDLGDLPPDQALRRLIEFTFDHHRANPEFIRLVMIENIHEGRHMEGMESLQLANTSAIRTLERICSAGVEAGLFRKDVSALQVHWQISAVSFFNVSNRATFEIIFGADLFEDSQQISLRERIVDSILKSVLVSAAGGAA
ncbi:TetR family transcriptional regulator [Qingshengfaniella alkalisoli]|uniref:TetR/AcrR family transcriptional regulator n=1 Tax=Qingshengfaniella alkalisoli TaxID=2599296 RepID=A0A5B8IBV4_9RHOB|nr:TetR family transcriptional regulator [Qingshengfaniella alkalisoli]QDY70976.1 TetR/AcrR family transcriptional regulator [Qingshengfaniella alkalisoli]